MNKTQLTCLLVSLVVAGLVLAWQHSRSHDDLLLVSRLIAEDLIRTTNSAHLGGGAAFTKELSTLLRAPTHVNAVKRGDVPPPFGDGTASSHLILSKNLRETLGIRLFSPEKRARKLSIAGFWSGTTRIEQQ